MTSWKVSENNGGFKGNASIVEGIHGNFSFVSCNLMHFHQVITYAHKGEELTALTHHSGLQPMIPRKPYFTCLKAFILFCPQALTELDLCCADLACILVCVSIDIHEISSRIILHSSITRVG